VDGRVLSFSSGVGISDGDGVWCQWWSRSVGVASRAPVCPVLGLMMAMAMVSSGV